MATLITTRTTRLSDHGTADYLWSLISSTVPIGQALSYRDRIDEIARTGGEIDLPHDIHVEVRKENP